MNAITSKPEYTLGQVVKIILIIAAIQAGFFGYSFWAKTDPVSLVNNNLPAVVPSAPTLAYYLTGSWGEGSMKKPMATAVIDRRIYVSDTGNQRVQVFDYNGSPLFKFGSSGEGPGQFRFPYGIAGTPDGRVLVADLYNGSVSIFDAQGQFQGYFAEADPKQDVFEGPAGLYVSGNRVYVSDVRKNRIMVFDLNGQNILEFGDKGSNDGQFASPNAVIVGGGRIYVSDTGNDRIQVFDEQGKFLQSFDGSVDGKSGGSVVNLRGLGLDGQGILYAVSNLTNHIHGLSSDGKPLFTFGEVGAADGQFYLPNGLFVDGQGRIYITDTANARVAVYQN